MSIQHKTFIGLIGLLLGFFITNSTASPLKSCGMPTYKNSNYADPCNEPAPTNFQVTSRTAGTITVAWDTPAIPPFQYNIKAFEVSSGNLVYNQNIGGNLTSWTVPNLQPNIEYEIRNTPVCPDGQLSPNFVTTLGQTLILDILVNSFSPSNAPIVCGFKSVGEYCNADPAAGFIVTFKIANLKKDIPDFRYFGVYKATNECVYTTIILRPEDEGSLFQFYCDSGANPPCDGQKVVIKHNGVDVSSVIINQPATGSKQLVCNTMLADYRVERVGGETGHFHGLGTCFVPPNDGRTVTPWQEISPNPSLSASPNPFTDQLDIQTTFNNPTENTKLSLYNLQGRLIMESQFPGDLQTITMSTENVSPGLYFLRAESGGRIETVKVVKTQ